MKPTFRASELDRVLSCNGSITLVPLVAPREGDEGFEGTMLHWLIADRAIRELGATPPDGGLPPPEVPKGYTVPKNSLWIVDWAMAHLREVVPDGWSLLVEVPLAYEFDRWDDSGHIDWLAISPDATEAIGGDWKTGRDPVEPADNNWQVFDYECLAKRAWETLLKITFQICQPRVTEEDDVERVSTSVLEGERLEAANATLDAAVCAALDNRMELNSSRKACLWCPVGCQCKALQLEQQLMKTTLTEADVARVKRAPDDALLGDWVINARTLARPTKDAEELLHARLDAAPALTAGCGTTITRKIQKGAYTIDQPVEFFKAAREVLVTDEHMAAIYKPSMTRLVDEVADVLQIPKQGKAPVTAQGVVDAKFKTFVTQGERRLLQFT